MKQEQPLQKVKKMKHYFFILAFLLLPMTAFPYGDRNIDTNVVFPSGCLLQNGGRIYDVTNPPSGNTAAIGNGVADDTEALRDAMDYVVAEYTAAGWTDQKVVTIYIPNGTYLVSDMICYRDANAIWDKWEPCNIRILGQSRAGVEIRLKDSCSGFRDISNPKPILSFNHPDADFNNGVAFNILRNVTVSAGSGNDGAIGVQFIGANSAGLANVKITADDDGGPHGLYMPVGSVHAYHHDITIENYNRAIFIEYDHDMYNAFEYLTIRDQRSHGIRHEGGGLYIRRMLCDQSNYHSGGIRLLTDGPQLCVYDSLFDGGSTSAPAVYQSQTDRQMTLLRNCYINGYTKAVDGPGSTVDHDSGFVEEFSNKGMYSTRPDQIQKSLALPAFDTPTVNWQTTLSNWKLVRDRQGSETSDDAAIQEALNSGKPCIYFPKKNYTINQPMTVPATVKQIQFMRCRFNWGANLHINESSSRVLLLDGIAGSKFIVTRNASRPVILRDCSADINTSTGIADQQQLFVENCSAVGAEDNFCGPNQSVWARGINNEEAEGNEPHDLFCNGGNLWIFGFKTENKPVHVMEAKNGGSLEALGGMVVVMPDMDSTPMIKNTDSSVSVSMLTQYQGIFTQTIEDTLNGVTRSMDWTEFPVHYGKYASNYFVPLYASFDLGSFTASSDYGQPLQSGSAHYSDGTYKVGASGDNGEGHIAYRTLNDSGCITAQLTRVDGTRAWRRAGLMMRETLDASSKYVELRVTGTGSASMICFNGSSTDTISTASVGAPCWLRLVRDNDTFEGYWSSDGTNWNSFGVETVSVGSSVLSGLYACGYKDDACEAEFENVILSNARYFIDNEGESTNLRLKCEPLDASIGGTLIQGVSTGWTGTRAQWSLNPVGDNVYIDNAGEPTDNRIKCSTTDTGNGGKLIHGVFGFSGTRTQWKLTPAGNNAYWIDNAAENDGRLKCETINTSENGNLVQCVSTGWSGNRTKWQLTPAD